jgi:hypothetical protein
MEKPVKYFIFSVCGIIGVCIACSVLQQFSKQSSPLDELLKKREE